MRIVFMGTPDFAVGPLQTLIGSRHEVTLVVTQPDRISGRGHKVTKSAVKVCAEAAGLPVFQPEKVRRPEAVERLAKEQPDVIVVAAYGQILPEEILNLPRYGCINIHGSLLPTWRGAAPIQWAVINGDRESGITIMQMDKGLDTGDILLQQAVPLDKEETAGSLYDKLSAVSGPLLLKALDELEQGTAVRTPQAAEKSTYARMLKKSDGQIDWSEPAQKIERLVRGLNPWPTAYTQYHGRQLKIWKSTLVQREDAEKAEKGSEQSADPDQMQPGTVLHVDENTFTVRCGQGALQVEEVQLEGKKRLSVHDFLLGYSLIPGEILGAAAEQ